MAFSPVDPDGDDWLLPDLKDIKWWWQLFGRRDEEMNGPEPVIPEKPCSSDELKKTGLKFPSLKLDIFGRK